MGIEGMKIVETGSEDGDKYYVLFTGRIGGASGVIAGNSIEELEKELAEFYSEKLIEQKNYLQNKVNELEELALRIKENGWEKTSQHYQNLQNKMEVGK